MKEKEFRVRLYDTYCDKTFEGTAISENSTTYTVIPDDSPFLTRRWRKEDCEIIKNEI